MARLVGSASARKTASSGWGGSTMWLI